MFPIFEQGKREGIDRSIDSFIERFNEICRRHIAERAQAFAFIFYGVQDSALRRILKDYGVFAKLD